ncbi:hypothetical protein N7495_005489 [Penicillium taxi]|uniref:uncharacterized protein n=1 Tax=Penicillium taxi TaxID=168475 RepID=UPI0025458E54|nr:uncharacterized protein N7495_005489 [Penicillium taxi]KAJ5893798.1 hypothetical protein N7495_005489 [Penicillium taxi]
MPKDFVIKHMNADHGGSVQLYLQAFCNISASKAQDAQIEDLTLNNLILSAKGTRYNIPIDPPMKTFNEARGRLVAMHKESLERLGRSDVVLTEYRAPQGFQIVIFGLVLFTFISCYQRDNLLPGSFVYEYLGFKYVPDFAHYIYTIQPILFPFVVFIHVVESILLATLKLKPHGVPVLSGLWCAWIASCLIEGFGCFQRIGQIVKEQQAKKHGKGQ